MNVQRPISKCIACGELKVLPVNSELCNECRFEHEDMLDKMDLERIYKKYGWEGTVKLALDIDEEIKNK